MLIRPLRACSVVLFALATAGCGEDGLALDEFFVVITNTWAVLDNAGQPTTHTFGFTSQDDGEVEGTFTGDESLNGVESPLTGSWAHNQVQFTVQRATGNVRYTAPLTADGLDRLELTSSTGARLTIQRL